VVEEFSSFDWPLLAMARRPNGDELQRMAEGLGRQDLLPTQSRRSWSSLHRPAAPATLSLPVQPGGLDAPRLLRRIMYRDGPALALVSNRDARSILVLCGEQCSIALSIHCEFEIADICALDADFSLFVLDSATGQLHELELTQRRMALAEEQGFRLTSEGRVYEVDLAALRTACFQLSFPLNRQPRRFAVAGSTQSQNLRRILLWESRTESLLLALLPSPGRPGQRPIRLLGLGREHAMPDDIPVISCQHFDTGLPASVLNNSEVCDVAISGEASYAWVLDPLGTRIAELGLPGSHLRSKVVLDGAALVAKSLRQPPARFASLIAYAPPGDFIDSVLHTQAYLDQKRSPKDRSTKRQREAMRTSLQARHLYALVERNSRAVTLAARFFEEERAAQARIELARIPAKSADMPEGDLHVTQGSGESLLLWSTSSDSFTEINPRFSLRASACAASMKRQEEIAEYKANKRIPDS
jgi:hypothetical protein